MNTYFIRTECSGLSAQDFFSVKVLLRNLDLPRVFFFTKTPSFLITCKSEMTVCVIVVGYESLKQL